ncbi:hypothetical protein AX16_000582 [Volvariella volvacea WC 439]|nr:hypothetical protein AX16_000582 [Volvariella volvacea WC 439]
MSIAESSVSARRSASPHSQSDNRSLDSDPPSSSRLSSPFMDDPERYRKTQPSAPRRRSPSPISVDIDVFSGSGRASRPSFLPTPVAVPSTPPPSAQRDHASSLHDSSIAQEVEHRTYVKRSKRSTGDSTDDASTSSKVVGITDSPNKGRRITLFQETSAESFEESLMAGGYGRYRTADWVRQPQPLAVPMAASTQGLINLLEKVEESPLSEREVRKRRRLDAFRGIPSSYASASRLRPVELEGKGRVLMEITPEEQPTAIATPEATPPKRRSNRRKRKAADTLNVNRARGGSFSSFAGASDSPSLSVKPNWPDSEFPWRLRGEEEAASAREEEDERLKYIERFLDEESEEEEEAEQPVDIAPDVEMWVDDEHGGEASRRRGSVTDQASDARIALLTRPDARRLSLRGRSQSRNGLCACKGKVDGRELVQCDTCQVWYHLECVGIKNAADLGPEENPWFCAKCTNHSKQPLTQQVVHSINPHDATTSAPVPKLAQEPTLVPSEPLQPAHVYDPPFFQPDLLQDSPMIWYPPRVPRTPTRSDRSTLPSEYTSAFNETSFSSASESSWATSSKHGQLTPAPASFHDAPLFNRTPAAQLRPSTNGYQESPFDPTSTPSRGIKFGAPFITPTPKDGWSGRGHPLFNTPSKSVTRGTLGIAATASFTDIFGGSVGKFQVSDDSPVRRSKPAQGDEIKPYQRLSSPSPRISARSSFAPPTGLEDSPVMRARRLSG